MNINIEIKMTLKKIVLDLETQSTVAKAMADCSMVFILNDELIGGSVC